MNMLETFKDLYGAQVRDLNVNRERIVEAQDRVFALREELRIAELALASHTSERAVLIIAAKGSLSTVRALDDAATAARQAEEWENLN